MRVPFAAICVKYKCLDSFELGACELLVPIFEQVRMCLSALVRSIGLDQERHRDHSWRLCICSCSCCYCCATFHRKHHGQE